MKTLNIKAKKTILSFSGLLYSEDFMKHLILQGVFMTRLWQGMVLMIFSLTFMMPLSAAEKGSGQIKWFDDYSKAVAEAKASNKPLLLFFTGSDWCMWCKKIEKEMFQTQGFVQEAGNSFVFVDVDFPMNKKLPENLVAQNASLKKKFGVTGFPTIIILNSQENFVAETGYHIPEGASQGDLGRAYAQYLKGLLK